MIDQLKSLAIFAKTIDHGSFRGAARELNLSPSVVSHHISQLEEQLGVPLIFRSTRKLRLTQHGERLLGAARHMLEAVEPELAALTAEASAPSGELRLTIPSVLSQSEFMHRVTAFSRAHPRIRLELDFSDTRRELIGDRFDLAIRMGQHDRRPATSRRLFTVQRRMVASTDYLATRARPEDPKDLESWDWMSLTPVGGVQLRFTCKDKVRVVTRPPTQIQTNDAQALYRLARAGAGVAPVPEYLATEDVAAGHVAFVLPDWNLSPIEVFAEWPANAPKHGLIHLALNALSAPGPAPG